MRDSILPFLSIPAAPWLADTVGLSMAEQGFVFRALITTWRTGPLPADDHHLARALGINRTELRKLRPALSTYFRQENDTLVCAWVEAEYRRATDIKQRKRAGAAQTNAARWGVAKRLAQRPESDSHCESQSVSPSSSSSSTSIKPPESVWKLIRANPKATDEQIARLHEQQPVSPAQVAEIRRAQ